MHAEFLRLADAGCRVLQIEEPWVHRFEQHREDSAMTREFYVGAFNRSVRGLRERLELWCHTCWGNPAQQRFYEAARSYAPALEHMNRLDLGVLTLQCARAAGGGAPPPPLSKGGGGGRGAPPSREGAGGPRAPGPGGLPPPGRRPQSV